MAEERTLGLVRARETSSETRGEEPSKEELQRRMDEARDSITNTVTEIKETVAQQVESVKDALDWREHFKRQPLAWSLGAAGVGFFVGYGIAAAFSSDERDEIRYAAAPAYSLTAQPMTREALNAETSKSNGKDHGPGLIERLRETSAYERLSQEAGAIGDRLVEELSSTAQQVVLPALLRKIKVWIGLDLSNKTTSLGNQHQVRTSYEPAVGSPS
ncbi:MAG: hypothetical protein ACRD9S_05690 [Pyrinomonadaceae bacterium]